MSALVVGLWPAAVFACDEETTAKAEVVAKGHVSVKVELKSSCALKVYRAKTVTATADNTKCPSKVINIQTPRRSNWEPGHLIEPDSMKMGPGDDLHAPDAEQWVILSSRGGVVHFHKGPGGEKKTEGRTLQQYGPYRVVLLPQLP